MVSGVARREWEWGVASSERRVVRGEWRVVRDEWMGVSSEWWVSRPWQWLA